MSDYTPTTEDVKDYFDSGLKFFAGFTTMPVDGKEFDRWLEQHDKGVAQATEERIIKLLDEQDKFIERGQFNKYFLIALIKGEQK